MKQSNNTNNLPNNPITQIPNDLITQQPNRLPLIFFGSSTYVIPIIKSLQQNFDLALVVTTEKSPTDAIPAFCITNTIPFISVSTLNDENIQLQLANIKCQIAVLADFGLIVPDKILSIFPMGIINIHPSLLPKYRGATPVQTAILNGDTKTGVTIIKLDKEVDHGPILAQKEDVITPHDNAETLYTRLFNIGAQLLPAAINEYVNGKQPISQNHTQATFTNRLTRQDGYFDSTNPPSKEELDRMIMAYYPWPGTWTKWKMVNGKWKILKFLPDKKIQVEGKKPMGVKDFINGYPELKQWIGKLI